MELLRLNWYYLGMEIPGPISDKPVDMPTNPNNSPSYPNNPFAQEILDAAASVRFTEDRRVVPVISEVQAADIANSGLGRDGRTSLENREAVASVFEGLAFDPEKVRSQMFSLMEGEHPIGVMTFHIVPKSYIEKQRYFKREESGLRIVDYAAVTGGELPEFCIIPAWTELLKTHRKQARIIAPAVRAFDKMYEVIKEEAPEGTWVESVPSGILAAGAEGEPKEAMIARVRSVIELSKNDVGTLIPFNSLPFGMEAFGVYGEESSATKTNAIRIGLTQVEGIASNGTLGPVYNARLSGDGGGPGGEVAEEDTEAPSQLESGPEIQELAKKIVVTGPEDLKKLRELVDGVLERKPYTEETKEAEHKIRWRRTAEQILTDGYVYKGKSCTDRVIVFLAVCKELGLEGRFVKMKGEKSVHSISEVKVGDVWYHFDPSYSQSNPVEGEVLPDRVYDGRTLWEKGRDAWDLGLVDYESIDKIQ